MVKGVLNVLFKYFREVQVLVIKIKKKKRKQVCVNLLAALLK